MTNSNYEIWAIQHNPEEVLDAIKGLEDSTDNVLFKNCKSYLRVGEKVLFVQFDTALLSEDKDRLVLLMKDSLISPEELQHILDNKKIRYNEVTFMDSMPSIQDDMKEIWFAREDYILRDALRDSKDKDIDTCEYYPDLGGRFELRHPLDEETFIPFMRQGIRGAVLLDDKIVLLMSNSQEMNLKYPDVLNVMYEEGMNPMIVVGETHLPEETVKQYKKEQ